MRPKKSLIKVAIIDLQPKVSEEAPSCVKKQARSSVPPKGQLPHAEEPDNTTFYDAMEW